MGGIFMKCDKYYYEKYAKLSICYLKNLNYMDFEVVADKPDLQNLNSKLGVEVVLAITKHEGLTRSLVNKYFGKKKSPKEIADIIKKENIKGKFKGMMLYSDNFFAISSSNGFVDTHSHVSLLLNKIREKGNKFSKYIKFETNGLYCFASSSIDSSNYEEIGIVCMESPFQIIFINCNDRIIIWESSDKKFTKYSIPDNCCREWKEKASARE